MNMNFLRLCFVIIFSLEAVLQDVAKNNSNKKELDAEIEAALKHMPAC